MADGSYRERWMERGAYIAKQRERIEQLESLVRDMYSFVTSRELPLCNACTDANGEFADCAACGEHDGACGLAKQAFEDVYGERMAALGMSEGGE